MTVNFSFFLKNFSQFFHNFFRMEKIKGVLKEKSIPVILKKGFLPVSKILKHP